ncbi:hypothetical protein WJX74_007024 [Apatococcus lobatus]|uniref:G domain-containing protein n=1 Tax=Apatococcus lobatus TaxID=904363 RepID=A0AAW1SF59_9CHLO
MASRLPKARFLRSIRSGSTCSAARPVGSRKYSPSAATTASNQDAAAATSLTRAPVSPLPSYCSGCGVRLQNLDASSPGFFRVPKSFLPAAEEEDDGRGKEEDTSLHQTRADELEELADPEETLSSTPEKIPGKTAIEAAADQAAEVASVEDEDEEGSAEPEDLDEFDREVESWLGGRPGGNPADSWRSSEESSSQSSAAGEAPQLLCARCYSLRNYGQVKDPAAENKLPSFDLGRKAGQKIRLQVHRRAIILCVVDVADFDGSLPRAALSGLLDTIGYGDEAPSASPRDLGHQLVVAVNKIDLLPTQISVKRLEDWVRLRLRQAGIPRPTSIHLVSSSKSAGVRDLVRSLHKSVGLRYDVWVVGAQNAGKSSLINAMRRAQGRPESGSLTTAWVPGTTVGMLRVPGLLPGKARMFDTPGVPHDHQMASLLTSDEVPLLLPKRRLQPRTFRLGEGQSIMLGALARIDVLRCPGATIYLTAWMSDQIPCHLGKTDAADERYQRHLGTQLFPPMGDRKRLARFPSLVATRLQCRGDSWQLSSQDVAIAGLGWVAVALNGMAELQVWAPPQVAVTKRAALAIDLAREMQKPGFAALQACNLQSGRCIRSLSGWFGEWQLQTV